MTRFPVPVVVVSSCLGFSACRYDGDVVDDGFVASLGRHVRLVKVCPEVEIGLGVPRGKIRLVGARPGPDRRLVQPSTGRDLTAVMGAFAEDYLALVGSGSVDGFVLKSRSPSCGIRDCKIFGDWHSEFPVGRGAGMFARAVIAAMPVSHAPVRTGAGARGAAI
jgi:uncharacterized protein YbbK (DUF523 family)